MALPSVTTVVRKTFLPLTIGEDQPRPGISVVHSTFSDFDHFSGRLELATAGLDEGPRKEGQSESAAKAIEIAIRLAEGAQSAIRWTKYALNNWLRQAGPSFDASLALEFMGFSGPEAKEGLASHKEKRRPAFPPASPL